MFRFYTKWERVSVLLLLFVVLFFSWRIYEGYQVAHSDVLPAVGGIYTEGVVGKAQFLNPLFSQRNPVDRDISRLIFSGLTKFNTQTGQIEDDLAVSKRSADNLTYTFTLLPDLQWHDGHPVTSDDIIFTYQTLIQNEVFPDAGLRDMFDDIKISKISNRAVSFQLSKPYSFFLANVTFGLLPKHLLELVPIENIDQAEFNQNPIGTGAYRFLSWVPNGDVSEITLKRFEGFYGADPKIDTVIFRVFGSMSDLFASRSTLSGYRTRSRVNLGDSSDSRFEIYRYQLPQYVALFLNTDSKFLKKKKTRFGLLLSTDKRDILKAVDYDTIVDTPVLESAEGLDIEYNFERAQGALFDSEWYLPGKIPSAEGGVVKKDTEVKAGEKLLFEIEAKADTWVSPVVDDQEKEGVTLRKGEILKYEAEKSLQFKSIGNAGATFVTVNGVLLRPLGGIGEVLRNVVFDRETLKQYMPEGGVLESSAGSASSDEQADVVEILDDLESDLVRVNRDGERFVLRLITAQSPPEYLLAAEAVQKQWMKVGVKLVLETYPLVDLQKKITQRDYDVLLFGQNLGYNLDAYPFWHSSQAREGLNLSQYRSINADSLLVQIRETFGEVSKIQLLDKLKAIIADDSPAIFLYAPTNAVLIDRRVKNVHPGKLSHDADRLSDLPNWYIKEDLELREEFEFGKFMRWLFRGYVEEKEDGL